MASDETWWDGDEEDFLESTEEVDLSESDDELYEDDFGEEAHYGEPE